MKYFQVFLFHTIQIYSEKLNEWKKITFQNVFLWKLKKSDKYHEMIAAFISNTKGCFLQNVSL